MWKAVGVGWHGEVGGDVECDMFVDVFSGCWVGDSLAFKGQAAEVGVGHSSC